MTSQDFSWLELRKYINENSAGDHWPSVNKCMKIWIWGISQFVGGHWPFDYEISIWETWVSSLVAKRVKFGDQLFLCCAKRKEKTKQNTILFCPHTLLLTLSAKPVRGKGRRITPFIVERSCLITESKGGGIISQWFYL